MAARARFADHFDIDWNPPDPKLRGKILVPILGDDYDKILERNELRIKNENNEFILSYFENRFPLAPNSIPDNVSV